LEILTGFKLFPGKVLATVNDENEVQFAAALIAFLELKVYFPWYLEQHNNIKNWQIQ
jgi:hypothetical protein